MAPEGYFSAEAGSGTRGFYYGLAAAFAVYTVISVFGVLIAPECDRPARQHRLPYSNLDFPNDPCRNVRYVRLGGLTKFECDMCTRILMSLIFGSIVGFERRRADRPAGIRTMAMVCMGACVFTIDSMFAFLDGTMEWDASRVSAAIPSGVGFLGAASIWKSSGGNGQVPEVHGLTTATSVWLSAAIGLLCGGGLYVPAFFATSCGVVYLRFAPRLPDAHGVASPEMHGSGLADLVQPLQPNAEEVPRRASRERSSSRTPTAAELRRPSMHM